MVARSSISLLIFCLILSITERVVLKSPTTTVNSFVPSFVYISFCFMYLEAVFFNCFSSTVVSIFPPPFFSTPCPHLPTSILPPLALLMSPLYMFLNDPSLSFPHYFPPLPLWFLSICSLFQCLWLYFVCLFVSLIRFHL